MEKFSEELQYSPVVSNHSTIIYRNVTPQSSQTATLSPTSSVGPVDILIPPSVWNPSKSRLNFTLTIENSGAGLYNWCSANLAQTISRVVFYDSLTNAVLMDVGNFDKYAAMVIPASTHIDEFLTKSYGTSLPTATAATAASLPIEDIVKHEGASNLTGITTGDLFPQNQYLGRRQQYISGNNADMIFNVSIPFTAFKHSFLSTNRNIYFPSNTVAQFYFSPVNQYVSVSDSATDASSNAVAYSQTTSAVTNITLQLANEANLAIVSQVIDKVMKEGLSLPIPYPTVTRQTFSAGTNFSYSISLTRGYGNRILAIITSPFVTANFNTNVHRRSSALGTDVVTFYNTFINNVPLLYPSGFDCTKGQDYMVQNKPYLEKSVVQTIDEYVLNEFLIVDGFCGSKPLWKYDEDKHDIDGLDVGAQSSTWSIQATTTSITPTFITAIIGQKMLTISNQGSMVV